MKKIKHSSILIEIMAAMILTLFLAIPLYAVEGPRGDRVGSHQLGQNRAWSEERFDIIAAKLGLSDEQKKKIKSLRDSQRQQMEALMEKLRAKQQQMQNELNNSASTRESIAPLAAEIKNIHAQLVDLRIDNIFAIKELLNSDQFRQLQQARRQWSENWQDRRQKWFEKRRGNDKNVNQEQ